MVLEHISAVLPNRAAVRQEAKTRLAGEAASKKLLDAYYADAIDTHELKTEQLRLASQRAQAQSEIEKHEVGEQHLRDRVDSCLALLDNAYAHYMASDEVSRKELNQAVFAHLYLDDDEIVGSDLKPAFQRLLSDTLEADLKTERKREQTTQSSTKNLWIVPEVRNRPTEVSPRTTTTCLLGPAGRRPQPAWAHSSPSNVPEALSLGKNATAALERTAVGIYQFW